MASMILETLLMIRNMKITQPWGNLDEPNHQTEDDHVTQHCFVGLLVLLVGVNLDFMITFASSLIERKNLQVQATC